MDCKEKVWKTWCWSRPTVSYLNLLTRPKSLWGVFAHQVFTHSTVDFPSHLVFAVSILDTRLPVKLANPLNWCLTGHGFGSKFCKTLPPNPWSLWSLLVRGWIPPVRPFPPFPPTFADNQQQTITINNYNQEEKSQSTIRSHKETINKESDSPVATWFPPRWDFHLHIRSQAMVYKQTLPSALRMEGMARHSLCLWIKICDAVISERDNFSASDIQNPAMTRLQMGQPTESWYGKEHTKVEFRS